MKRNIINSIFAASVVALMSLTTACDDKDYDSYSLNTTYAAPVVQDVTPSEGLPSSIVTIKGSNFGSEQHFEDRIGRVYFGGVEASEIVSWSDNEIKVRVPDGGQSGQVSVWVWKNHSESPSTFTCVPGAEILSIDPSPTFPGSSVSIKGKNFGYFIEKGLAANDITVYFTAENGTTESKAKTFTDDTITVDVPFDAKGGAVSVKFGDYQTVTGPQLPLIGDMVFALEEYYEKDGTVSVSESCIDSTKKNAWVMYKFTAPATGLFDVYAMWGTTKNGVTVNVDINSDFNYLKTNINDELTQAMPNTGAWATTQKMTWGAFYLKESETYYVKVTFFTADTSWAGNIYELGLTLSADQNQTAVNGGGSSADYVLYKNDFNGSSLYPFTEYWAWDPSYIKIENGYCEFYFNQAALDANDRRERRGCELVCDFGTNSEAWYGFKIFLPEGMFAKDLKDSIIAQFFNSGRRNSWAGHLSITDEDLVVYYRPALIDPTIKTVGKLKWGVWQNVIVYFRVGKNNKGNIKVWLTDENEMPMESNPTLDCGDISWGFAENWLDDTHFDSTPYEYEGKTYTDKIGGKWGLYVSVGGDRTIRFDNLRILEGNPAGAFNLVNPAK